MDIIDIILARAKSFTGETKTLVQQAQAAMAQANEVSAILQDAQEANAAATLANENAQAANEAAQASAEAYDTLINNFNDDAESIVNEKIAEATDGLAVVDEAILDTLGDNINSDFSLTKTSTRRNDAMETDVTLNLIGNESTTASAVVKNYTTYGDNEDGSMTQKAIKNYVEGVKSELNATISSIPAGSGSSSGGSTNLGSNNSGNIVVIDSDGNIIAGSTSEVTIIEALIKSGAYVAKDTVGLEIDYENKTFTRTQEATYYTQGQDFNKYSMYGGRMRCNVADNGVITAWYGDTNYKEDGSNGQVMVYQPKFYYQRTPIKLDNTTPIGKIIRKESLLISPTAQPGFKLHPIFKAADGSELNYVLLPAYEATTYDVSINAYNTEDAVDIDFDNDLLCSIANVKPISGAMNELNQINAEKLASNRGEGWHIMNIAAESVNQMLEIVEFGTVNGQYALEDGICDINTNQNINYASQTGSTASLGNTTGAATSTINISEGVTTTYDVAGKRAISYRGMENPWGNIWNILGGINLVGNGESKGGIPYICTDFNYSIEGGNNYKSVGFCVPSIYNWVSGFGYGNSDYDWVFMPAECSSVANSALPIGDNFWSIANLNTTNLVAVGGTWVFKQSDGPFYYACDKAINHYGPGFGVKLMYIPTKNDVYTSNYNKWLAKMGG